MVSKRTIQRRIAKGMTREQAAKIPPYFSKLTVDNVIKVREHGRIVTGKQIGRAHV